MTSANIHRPKNQDRLTPFYDAWLAGLQAALDDRGHGGKTELARFISSRAGKSEVAVRQRIPLILARRVIAGGEFVCGANAWMRTARIVE